jgi:hypothetical protein
MLSLLLPTLPMRFLQLQACLRRPSHSRHVAIINSSYTPYG